MISQGEMTFPSQAGSLYALKNMGWQPTHAIDIGAYHGEWTLIVHHLFPTANVLMVEAQESKREILQSATATLGGQASLDMSLLGAADGQEVEFVEMETGSSVFEEASEFPREKITKTLATLDSVVRHHPGFESPQVLKLDTQGYELEILKGAGDVLGSVEVVILETSLIPVNEGAPVFAEVVDFMSRAGFKLFDICGQVRRTDGVLWQADLMFVHNEMWNLIDKRLTRENWG